MSVVRSQPHPIHKHLIAFEDGRIFHKKLNKFLDAKPNALGYIQICKGGYLAHRIIYEAFRGLIEGDLQVDHINCVRDANALINLQLMTPAAHKAKTLLDHPDAAKKAAAARKRPVARLKLLTDGTCERVVYDSAKEAAQQNPTAHKDNITACINGKRPVAGGYRWECARPEIVDQEGEYWACPINKAWRGIEVSNKGRIKQTYGNLYSGQKTKDGYFRIKIRNIQYGVHDVVCEVFNGFRPVNAEGKPETPDHVDQDKGNNDATNLRWGDRNVQCRNRSNSVRVSARSVLGNTSEFSSMAEAAEVLNVSRSDIETSVRHGSVRHGYVFTRV